jgi:CubicO group peptidase (beta-lactamase class C family)
LLGAAFPGGILIHSAEMNGKRRALSWCLYSTALLACVGAWQWFRPDRAFHATLGGIAHDLCANVFIGGRDPRQTYAEDLAPGLYSIGWGIHYDIDRAHDEVRADFLGGFGSRAVFRNDFGCVILHGQDFPAATSHSVATPPDDGEPAVPVEATDPRLRAALDAAFAEPAQPPHKWVKAVIIMHDGRIIAERYASGYTSDTPIFGYSLSKSVVNALIGILVRQGTLSVTERAPVAAWRKQDDPRHAITVEEMMRMTSGLDLVESNRSFDPWHPRANQLLDAPDMAAYAEDAPLRAVPGRLWSYSSAGTHILARIVRDAAGGNADRVRTFATRQLFVPLGMRHVTMELDATGTPIGSSGVLASARDWARFGTLYLDGGVANGQRILPEGWPRFSATSTLNTTYGAGWWTNRRGDTHAASAISAPGMPIMADVPDDAYYAMGNLGQFVVVIPSRRLVVVRLGRSYTPFFGIEDLDHLVAAALAAVGDR